MAIKRTESVHKRISSRRRRAIAFKTHLQHVEDRRIKIAKIIGPDRIKLRESGFD